MSRAVVSFQDRFRGESGSGKVFCNGTIAPIVLVFVSGCAATLDVKPALPPPVSAPVSRSGLGIFFSPGGIAEVYEEKHGSGIWPGTVYRFSPGQLIQEDLTTLSERHYRKCGFAENAVDDNWDLVVEYFCYPPRFKPKTLEAQAPLQLTLRDPHTARVLESATLYGKSPAQPGRWLRLIAGRLAEKPALEKTLSEAYSDLYRKVDGTLARAVAKEQYESRSRPYHRRSSGRRRERTNRGGRR